MQVVPSGVGSLVGSLVDHHSIVEPLVFDTGVVLDIGAASLVGCPVGCMDVGVAHPHGHVRSQNPGYIDVLPVHMDMPAEDSEAVVAV